MTQSTVWSSTPSPLPAFQDGHPKLLVMGSALMCSGAMGLSISGFPNMTACKEADASGKRYLQAHDFLLVGMPCSVFVYGCIITIGYVCMMGVGF